MITAGIDVGVEYTKAVVLRNGAVAGKACGPSGGAGRLAAVRAIYEAALTAAGIRAEEVGKAFATGKGKFDAPFADGRLAEVVTAARAAVLSAPGATMVIDAGADETAVAVLDGEKIREFVLNQKCAAGLGLFLESMAERFEMTIDELSALTGPSAVTVNDGCVVFAEQDALGLANRGADLREVCKAAIEAGAWRAYTTINDIYRPVTSCVVLMGGLAKNAAFVAALERISGMKLTLCDDPQYAPAIGAASLAGAEGAR